MTTFSLDISKFAEKVGERADQVVREICLNLLSEIVYKTPVDTGRARANWLTSINAPAIGTVEFDADAGSGITAPNSSAASVSAINNGVPLLKQATGNIFWISNNLPYIYRLEYEGWSKQAPRGMVRIAIDNMKRDLR